MVGEGSAAANSSKPKDCRPADPGFEGNSPRYVATLEREPWEEGLEASRVERADEGVDSPLAECMEGDGKGMRRFRTSIGEATGPLDPLLVVQRGQQY